MSPTTRILLLLGCVLVAAVEGRPCARVACQDWFGPYPRGSAADAALVLGAPETPEIDTQEPHDGDADAGAAEIARLGDDDAR